MSNPFLMEIRIFSFNFAPKGWALCNGQLLPINQNQALFSLVGTQFGGDGRTTFGLPNLQGRVAIHTGPNFSVIGQGGGEETHTLIQSEMPAHNHLATADVKVGNGDSFIPTNTLPANAAPTQIYSPGSNNMTAMAPQMVSNVGASQAHENRQPYLALNFCIALQGIFPSRN